MIDPLCLINISAAKSHAMKTSSPQKPPWSSSSHGLDRTLENLQHQIDLLAVPTFQHLHGHLQSADGESNW